MLDLKIATDRRVWLDLVSVLGLTVLGVLALISVPRLYVALTAHDKYAEIAKADPPLGTRINLPTLDSSGHPLASGKLLLVFRGM